MNTIEAKTGQRVKVTDPKFQYFSIGSICECTGDKMFKLIDGYSLHDEVWMMEAKRYEIIEEQTETINPLMVVISWADWLEYQNLKNKQNV